MFSANENIALRQYKKRVVEYVESCIPEEALDLGTMVMAMQVSCKAPGCVPLETAIVIVFPKLGQELISGLPESKGGNYKTKVLKPMAEVTQEDIYEALPPEFPGGTRSVEKLCLQARDVMLGQITQLFADEDKQGRILMTDYLQQCLKEYAERDYTPPEWGEPFAPLDENGSGSVGATNTSDNATNGDNQLGDSEALKQQSSTTSTKADGVSKTGNFVFKRPVDDADKNGDSRISSALSPGTTMTTTAKRSIRQNNQTNASSHNNSAAFSTATIKTTSSKPKTSQSIMAQLGERQHAPGIRRQGCPCCDPDSAENMIDEMMPL